MAKKTQQRQVLVNESGRILSSAPMMGTPTGEGGPTAAGLAPGGGGIVHELEVPEEFASGDPGPLFEKFRVAFVPRQGAVLVDRDARADLKEKKGR
jgi:hypothetical protein